MADAAGGRERAQGLRRSLVEYVRAVHTAYLDAAARAGGEAGELPLAGEPFCVAAVAADQLHLLATRDALPPVQPHEEPVDDEAGPLRWQVRFLDVTVVPELGQAGDDVRGVLGVADTLYHLQVRPEGSLDGHQALHAGTGLAHAHLGRSRG